MKNQREKGFRCPEVVPPGASDDFCIPKECCPDRIEMFKFPSPNSCLPEEVLEALELRIEEANQFLLDVALSDEREKNEIFRSVFEGLIGQEVKVILNCSIQQEETTEEASIRGRIFLAGRDFSIVRNGKKEIIIPHENICFIDPVNRFAVPDHRESLNDIDPCLRRCITYRFGKVVSNSPELINIFFGLDLRVYLLTLIDKKVKVKLDNETLEGAIFDVDRDSFTLCGEKRLIKLENVCTIVVEDC